MAKELAKQKEGIVRDATSEYQSQFQEV